MHRVMVCFVMTSLMASLLPDTFLVLRVTIQKTVLYCRVYHCENASAHPQNTQRGSAGIGLLLNLMRLRFIGFPCVFSGAPADEGPLRTKVVTAARCGAGARSYLSTSSDNQRSRRPRVTDNAWRCDRAQFKNQPTAPLGRV